MFSLDQRAIQEAADFLGLEHPIHVQTDGRFRNMRGRYNGLQTVPYRARWYTEPWPEPRHVILLAKDMTADQASRTLWHELTHALQCERDYIGDWRSFFRDYNDALRAVRASSIGARTGAGHGRYQSISFEVEAREYECLAETDPLAS